MATMYNFSGSLAINARFLVRQPFGVDRVAIELVTALANRSDVRELLLLHPRGQPLFQDWISELPVASRHKVSLHPFGRMCGHLWEQFELPLALRDRPLLSLCSTGPILRSSHVVMIHDAQVWDAPESYSAKFRLLYKLLLPLLGRTARHVLTVSKYSADRLNVCGIAAKGKLRIVLNGADHILRSPPDPHALDRNDLVSGGYLLAVGSLAPHKNLPMLVSAAAKRPAGGPPLVIAGSMNSRVFGDAGVSHADGVRYIGRVSEAELVALYKGAIALVFPSLTEGFGLPTVEAMLCECPVVATTAGAVSEICGDSALYVDPLDTKGWTTALIRIVEDQALRADLIARGKTRAAEYTWESAAKKILSVLRDE